MFATAPCWPRLVLRGLIARRWPRAMLSRVREYLADPGHPLFDRCIQMALPPGSVFKTLTAVALLHQAGFDPQKPWDCQGYLQTPDRRRWVGLSSAGRRPRPGHAGRCAGAQLQHVFLSLWGRIWTRAAGRVGPPFRFRRTDEYVDLLQRIRRPSTVVRDHLFSSPAHGRGCAGRRRRIARRRPRRAHGHAIASSADDGGDCQRRATRDAARRRTTGLANLR